MRFFALSLRSVGAALVLCLAGFAQAPAADAAEQPPWRGAPRNTRSSASGGNETRAALSIHGALRYLHQAESGLFAANEADFGATPVEEFEGGWGVEIALTVHPRADVFVGAEWSESAFDSSYLDYTYEDGREIVHSTFFESTDFDVGVRFRVLPSDLSWQPYLAGGFSASLYRYLEDGEFLDGETIYYDRYEERQLLPGFFAAVGVEVALGGGGGARTEVFGEARYSAYGGTHEDDFTGFGRIENHWLSGRLGFRFRF